MNILGLHEHILFSRLEPGRLSDRKNRSPEEFSPRWCTPRTSKFLPLSVLHWRQESKDGETPYLAVKLDDPSFAGPMRAAFFENEADGTGVMVWRR